MHPLPAFPLRPTPRHAWAPMTDAEWALLAPLVTRETGAGRPARDPRRLWDAIFWVACSSGPWRDLPAEFGRADTAHRALRRHSQSGLLGTLLVAVSPHPVNRGLFATLAWRVARAWRRVTRLLTMGQLLLARRLGLLSALPGPPDCLPKPHLSETIAAQLPFLRIRALWPTLFPVLRNLHRAMEGDRRAWRLTD
jgi:transposase